MRRGHPAELSVFLMIVRFLAVDVRLVVMVTCYAVGFRTNET